MKAEIVRASGRAKCGICEQKILKGEIQIHIVYRDCMNLHGSNINCNRFIISKA